MFCEKCGGELRQEENKLICTKCGAEFGLDYNADDEADSKGAEYVIPRGFSSKKNIIIIIVAVLLMICGIGTIVAVNVTKSNSQTALTDIQIAERFLSEQNYEQAIIEFEKILEIEPMNVEAYLGLAEAYIGLDDIDKAIDILKKGLELTGDSRIKAKFDELLASKEIKPVLSWSEIDGNTYYLNFGHYVKNDGELWRFCNDKGEFVSEKKYKYIKNFAGTEDENFSLGTTEDGRVFSIDKNYNELFELENPDNYIISNQENPLIISWHNKNIPNENDNDFLTIYSVNGQILFNWNGGEYSDGSGKPLDINDPALPEEAKSFDCNNEFHNVFWVESVVNTGYTNAEISGNNAYVSFSFFISYDYDKTEENADKERRKQEALNNNTIWIEVNGTHGHYSTANIVYNVSLKNGKLVWEKSDILSDYTEWGIGMGYDVILETDEYTLYQRLSPMAMGTFSLASGNTTKHFLCFNEGKDYKNFDISKINFNYVSSFIDDKLMICGRYTDESREKSQYALFRINWKNTDELNSERNDEEILNMGHERITEFYDGISSSENDLELGYCLVNKNGKWGYISLETGKEIAMFDDASDFSNGYAVVTTNGVGHIIDKDFNVVSEDFPCDSASLARDGSFTISCGDEIKRLELK